MRAASDRGRYRRSRRQLSAHRRKHLSCGGVYRFCLHVRWAREFAVAQFPVLNKVAAYANVRRAQKASTWWRRLFFVSDDSPLAGGKVTLWVTVTNVGVGASGAMLRYYRSSDATIPISGMEVRRPPPRVAGGRRVSRGPEPDWVWIFAGIRVTTAKFAPYQSTPAPRTFGGLAEPHEPVRLRPRRDCSAAPRVRETY